MAGENLECIAGILEAKAQVLDLQTVKKLTTTLDTYQGILFFLYDSPELFRGSDLFQNYYNLGEQTLAFSPDNQTLQIFGLDKNMHYVMHLQWLLIILGYLDATKLSGNYCDMNPDTTTCDRTVHPGRYFGVFGNMTQESIKTFQADYGLTPTGKVDEATKETLYRLVYEHFHSSEKQECITETKGKIMNLQ